MIIFRLCKIVLVAAIALFFTLVAFGNITDYQSNWQFVQHVLSMDTTFPESSLRWRAISDPTFQAAAYQAIIATEVVIAALLWLSAVLLLLKLTSPDFNRAKSLGVVALTLGFLLYCIGFIEVGGEWFAMWQSQIWNGQQKAFDFIGMIGIVLVVLLLPDDLPVRSS